MFKKLALMFTVWALEGAKLSAHDERLLTARIVDRVTALPASAILKLDTDGTLVLNGKRVDAKTAFAVHKSAARVLNERAFKIAIEQTRFAAVEIGVYQALTTEQVMFAKAALWQLGEQVKLLNLLAGTAPVEDLDEDD